MSPAYFVQSSAGSMQAVMWLAASASTAFVGLRCYVRLGKRNAFGLDDIIALAATVCLIAYASVTTAAASKGLGRHIEYVAQQPNGTQDLIDIALLCDLAEVFAILSCTLGKTSFAITLYRIVIEPWIQGVLWFIIITLNVVNVLAAIFVFAQCQDPRHLWNPAIPSKCWPTYVFTDFSLFVGAYSCAQDFILALLPWIFILRLNMNKKEKLTITFAMSLGVFAGAASIVKTTYLVNLSKKSDYTWALPPLLWWAAAEDGLTIVACSIPVLRPLLRKIIPGSSAKRSDPENAYNLHRYANSGNAMAIRPDQGRSDVTVETLITKDNHSDDGSDRSILEQHSKDNQEGHERSVSRMSGIVTTREVAVTYGS